MKPLAIARANLIRQGRDRLGLFFVFLLPLLLILLLGLIFGGSARQRLGVVDLDEGALGADLVARLAARDDVDLSEYDDQRTLIARIERRRIEAGIVIPADYSEVLKAGNRADVSYVAEFSPYATGLRSTIEAAVADHAAEVTAARFLQQQELAEFDQGLTAAAAQRERIGGITVSVGPPRADERELGQYDRVASQNLILMVFLVSLTASTHLIRTRRLGVARRMLATPTSPTTVILGEALGRFAIALIQGLFIVTVSAVVFDVEWGDPLAAVAIVALFALVGSGAAMLIGSLVSNDSQAAAVTPFVALALGALGGCMVPLQFMPETMQTVAHATPHAWALDGFDALFRRDVGIEAVVTELAVLAGFGVAMLAAASWRLQQVMAR